MKKIIIGILALIFLGLLVLNFGFETKSKLAVDTESPSEKKTEVSKDEHKDKNIEPDSEKEEDVSQKEENYIFNDEDLNARYQELKEQNEPLVVSVLLPSYYSNDFISSLEDAFNTDTISFKRIDIEGNTTSLGTLPYFDNSDAVMISALQIQDYNDEVLPQHNLNKMLAYYMDFYNNGMTAIVLSEPNAHEHNNLENVLLEDQDYMSNNDYYFVSNVDVEADAMFNEDETTLSTQVEKQIISNIKKFLVK